MNISQQDTSSICYVEIPAPSIEETTNFYKEALTGKLSQGILMNIIIGYLILEISRFQVVLILGNLLVRMLVFYFT